MPAAQELSVCPHLTSLLQPTRARKLSGDYCSRNVRIGFTHAARIAGASAAKTDTDKRVSVTVANVEGSRGCTRNRKPETSLTNSRDAPAPARTPKIVKLRARHKTIARMSDREAPKAIRRPSSRVRSATM